VLTVLSTNNPTNDQKKKSIFLDLNRKGRIWIYSLSTAQQENVHHIIMRGSENEPNEGCLARVCDRDITMFF